jgi:SAM-dependent methyltransferase
MTEHSMAHTPDRSNGWEAVATTFIVDCRRASIGADVIGAWANRIPEGGAFLDLGCGPGGPRAEALHRRGTVCAIDAAPTLVKAYQVHFPKATVACEPAEESNFFGRTFDGVLACGLLFLLTPEAQSEVIRRVGDALKPGGRFLFTAPWQVGTWTDNSTGRLSTSLGREHYCRLLRDAGLMLVDEHTDVGENHYYEAMRPSKHR